MVYYVYIKYATPWYIAYILYTLRHGILSIYCINIMPCYIKYTKYLFAMWSVWLFTRRELDAAGSEIVLVEPGDVETRPTSRRLVDENVFFLVAVEGHLAVVERALVYVVGLVRVLLFDKK